MQGCVRLLRFTLAVLAAGLVLSVSARAKAADDYPVRPIRVIVHYPPGGGTDLVARMVGRQLEQRLSQSVVIENKPGANGIIGGQAVLNAPADGYTLFFHSGSSMSTVFNKSVPFDILKDFAQIVSVYSGEYVLFISATLPVATYPEFVAYAKANPGKLNYGSAAPSTMLSMEAFKARAGITMLGVPYKGSAPTTTAMLGNEVQAAFDGTATNAQHVRAGKLRAIGIGGTHRNALLPDVPTMADTFPGLETVFNVGVSAAAATPRPAITRLNQVINAIIETPALQEQFTQIGGFGTGGTPEAFKRRMQDEIQFYASTAKAVNYTPE